MKQITLLFLLFIPFCAWADDACTNPEAYTIDRRCYVTEEQKKEKPYNAVATLVYPDGRTHCSGTVVKRQGLTQDDIGYFFYTAKHCIDSNHDNIPDDLIRIKLPNGQEFNAQLVKKGNYNLANSTNQTGDWAKYVLQTLEHNSKDDVKDALGGAYVKINNSFARSTKDIRIIGYGSLKIMSDQEIQQFKDDFIKFMETMSFAQYEQTEDGGIYGSGIQNFINFYSSHFKDSLLKVSKCSQNAKSEITGCQGWGGNSGGGAFDNNGNLMWIITLGNYQIGGTGHGSIVGGINFLPFGRLPDEEKQSTEHLINPESNQLK